MKTLVKEGAVPFGRKSLPGCDPKSGDFVTDEDGEDGGNLGNLGLVWHAVSGEGILEFTRRNHCQIIEAFFDE